MLSYTRERISKKPIIETKKEGKEYTYSVSDRVHIKASTEYGVLLMLSMQNIKKPMNGHQYDE